MCYPSFSFSYKLQYHRKLLTVDHNKRLTVQEAIAHPWLGKTPEELAKFSLDSNLATLRKYQATRKLRAAVHTVIAANRMKSLMEAIRGAADVINAEDDEEAAKLAAARPASATKSDSGSPKAK